MIKEQTCMDMQEAEIFTDSLIASYGYKKENISVSPDKNTGLIRVRYSKPDNPSTYECDDKMVSHPSHYQMKGGMEVIDIIEACTDGLEGIEATDTGNVLKYICRWKHKNGLQDLKKAMWYLTHLINKVEKESK